MSTSKVRPPDAGAVIDRMKEALDVPSDAALAELLSTSRSRISKWRTRGSVPYEDAIYLALRFDLSLDFLLTGRRDSRASKSLIDEELLALVAQGRMSRFKGGTISPAQWAREAREIADTYGRVQQMMTRFIETNGLDPSAAKAAALAAVEAIRNAKEEKGPQ